MPVSKPAAQPIRQSTRNRSPTKQGEQYRESIKKAANKRDNYERSQTVRKQREEDVKASLAPSRPGVGNTKAPLPTKGGRMVAATVEKKLDPIHPGPRPASADELNLGVLIEEWKRQRLIWYISLRNNIDLSPHTDYDALKIMLGMDEQWDSEDEWKDVEISQQCRPGATPPVLDDPPQFGHFDKEPPRRKPIPVEALPPPKPSQPELQATAKQSKGKRKAVAEPESPLKRPRKDCAPKTLQNPTRIQGSSGLVIPAPNTIRHTLAVTPQATHPDQSQALPVASKSTSNTSNTAVQSRSSSFATVPRSVPQLPHPSVPKNHNKGRAPEASQNGFQSPRTIRQSSGSTTSRGQQPGRGSGNINPSRTQGGGDIERSRLAPVSLQKSRKPSNRSMPTASTSSHTASSTGTGSTRTQSTSQNNSENICQGARVSSEEHDEGTVNDEDNKDRATKNQRKAGARGRLKDYTGVERSILKSAGYAYQAIMVTKGMYETDTQILGQRRHEAWRLACDQFETNPSDYPLTDAHIQSMNDRLVSWRGKAAAAIAPDVGYLFFGKKYRDRKLSPKETEEYIEKLKDGRLHMKLGAERGKGHFQHQLLQICMNKIVFKNSNDIGVVYMQLFRCPSVQLVCYFCAIIQHLCEGYAPSAPAKEKLEFEDQRRAYLTHIGSHAVWLKKRNKRRWIMIQDQLYLRGFKHSRADGSAEDPGIEKHMLQDEDVMSDDPDAEELEQWDTEMNELGYHYIYPGGDESNHKGGNEGDSEGDSESDEGEDEGKGEGEDEGEGEGEGEDEGEGKGEGEGEGEDEGQDGAHSNIWYQREQQHFDEEDNPNLAEQDRTYHGRTDDELEYTQAESNYPDDRDRDLSSDYGDDFAPKHRKYIDPNDEEDNEW